MTRYKLSTEAKMDLARIYWRGVEWFGEVQANRYYDALVLRFDDIAEAPYKFPAVDHIREGYRRSICGVDNIYFRVKRPNYRDYAYSWQARGGWGVISLSRATPMDCESCLVLWHKGSGISAIPFRPEILGRIHLSASTPAAYRTAR